MNKKKQGLVNIEEILQEVQEKIDFSPKHNIEEKNVTQNTVEGFVNNEKLPIKEVVSIKDNKGETEEDRDYLAKMAERALEKGLIPVAIMPISIDGEFLADNAIMTCVSSEGLGLLMVPMVNGSPFIYHKAWPKIQKSEKFNDCCKEICQLVLDALVEDGSAEKKKL